MLTQLNAWPTTSEDAIGVTQTPKVLMLEDGPHSMNNANSGNIQELTPCQEMQKSPNSAKNTLQITLSLHGYASKPTLTCATGDSQTPMVRKPEDGPLFTRDVTSGRFQQLTNFLDPK